MKVHIQKQHDSLKHDFDLQVNGSDDFKYTLEEYKEASAVAEANIFYIEKAGVRTCTIVPLTHVFNFNHDNQTLSYFDEKEQSFMIVARKDIARGSEISVTQHEGQILDNHFFMMRKGYYNPFRQTRVPFTVILDKRDPLYH